jgi:hypothetical protein
MGISLRQRLESILTASEKALKALETGDSKEAQGQISYIKGMVDGTLGTTRADIRKCLDNEF